MLRQFILEFYSLQLFIFLNFGRNLNFNRNGGKIILDRHAATKKVIEID